MGPCRSAADGRICKTRPSGRRGRGRGPAVEDRIEQRVSVRATVDVVWQLVTRPGWWLPGSKAEPATGPGRATVEYGDDKRPYIVDVVRVEPKGYVSYRWAR